VLDAVTTLTRPKVADLLGITYKQARRLEGIVKLDTAGVRVAKVAVALARAVGNQDTSLSSLPAMARAVHANPPPAAPFHAVYRDGAVSYVIYPADLARTISDGAVVAKIDQLYPAGDDHE
jgi:hypothetical protein